MSINDQTEVITVTVLGKYTEQWFILKMILRNTVIIDNLIIFPITISNQLKNRGITNTISRRT